MRSHDYPTQTGAQLLVDALRIQGVDTIFCVPGESFLSVLDALRDAKDDIRLIVCRHEGAAANMAEAYGKLTGTPGICIVSRGPGATHASIGVHTAKQNSTPMSQNACMNIAAFAEANRLPTAVAFRFQDLFDNRHELYIGEVGLGINPHLAQCVRDADLLLAVGPRLSEASVLSVSHFFGPNLPLRVARWAMACPPPLRRSCGILAELSSPSPVTGAFSVWSRACYGHEI